MCRGYSPHCRWPRFESRAERSYPVCHSPLSASSYLSLSTCLSIKGKKLQKIYLKKKNEKKSRPSRLSRSPLTACGLVSIWMTWDGLPTPDHTYITSSTNDQKTSSQTKAEQDLPLFVFSAVSSKAISPHFKTKWQHVAPQSQCIVSQRQSVASWP